MSFFNALASPCPLHSEAWSRGSSPIPVLSLKGKEMNGTCLHLLDSLWATWGTHFCPAWFGDQWKWLHILDLRLEALKGRGSFHGRWKLHRTTDMQNMRARNYRQRNTEHLRPQEKAWVKLLGKLRHLKTCIYTGELGGRCTHKHKEDKCCKKIWDDLEPSHCTN